MYTNKIISGRIRDLKLDKEKHCFAYTLSFIFEQTKKENFYFYGKILQNWIKLFFRKQNVFHKLTVTFKLL